AVSFPFQVAATDRRGQTTAQDCSITVNAPAFSVSSACPLPPAITGAAYHAQLPNSFTWSLAGTLPAGLTLSPDGAISGTPMSAGPARFRLIGTHSNGGGGGAGGSLPR